MSLAGLLHPKVNPPAPEAPEVPAAVVPRCGDVDPLSGAVCNRVFGHFEPRHKAVDQDFEIWWDRG